MEKEGIEQQIIDYIENNEKEDYNEIIHKDNRIKIIQALSDIRENIVSWYPFKENSEILEIGADFGQITGYLCEKSKNVVSLEKSAGKRKAILKRHKKFKNLKVIDNIENLQQKFDYITLIGMENITDEPKNMLIILKKYLKEDGKILIATDNKMGIQYFCRVDERGENITNFINKKLYTLIDLEKIINEVGFENLNVYFPMPDYKLTNVIYTREKPISLNNLSRNIVYNEENSIKFYEQNNFFKEILNNKELIELYMNSFFIEIFNGKYEKVKIKLVLFSNIRKTKYRIKTIIKEREVYKYPALVESKNHIEKIKNNIDIIKKSNLNILDSYDEERIISKYTRSQTFDKLIIETIKIDKNKAIELMMKFKQELSNKLEYENKENNVFDRYGIKYDKEIIKDEIFIKNGLWDLIFQNCFFINNKFYFFDQEWMEENIPINFIFYRAIRYLDGIKKYFSEAELLKLLEINENLVGLFEQLDNKLQETITDDLIWKIHTQGKTLLDLKREKLTDNNTINLLKIENRQKENLINQKENEIQELRDRLNSIYNSKSWKITQALRKISNQARKDREE